MNHYGITKAHREKVTESSVGLGCWKTGALSLFRVGYRDLARISKMPVQNNNFKVFARPDLATYPLQILLPATFNSIVC